VFGSLTAGYETTLGGFFISPYARLDVSHSTLDAFSEDGDVWSAIRYGRQSIDTLTGILGLRLAYKIPTDWGVVMPKLRLEYSHDFASGSSLALSYANITGSPSYLLKAAGTARDYATITLGTDSRSVPDGPSAPITGLRSMARAGLARSRSDCKWAANSEKTLSGFRVGGKPPSGRMNSVQILQRTVIEQPRQFSRFHIMRKNSSIACGSMGNMTPHRYQTSQNRR